MTRIKMTTVTNNLTDRHLEMVAEIIASKGYPSRTAVIQQAIVEMHGNIFKDYVMVKKQRNEKPDTVETAKTNKTDLAKNICHMLDGDLVERNGTLYCDYYKYDKKNRFKQEVLLESITQIEVDKQYFPNKQFVKDLQNQGRVNYEIEK